MTAINQCCSFSETMVLSLRIFRSLKILEAGVAFAGDELELKYHEIGTKHAVLRLRSI